MVSQDLIYSILPRQTGQVTQQHRMVEQVVRRSSLKPVDENESAPLDTEFKVKEKRRGDRRRKDRRDDEATKASDKSEDDKSQGLDIYI